MRVLHILGSVEIYRIRLHLGSIVPADEGIIDRIELVLLVGDFDLAGEHLLSAGCGIVLEDGERPGVVAEVARDRRVVHVDELAVFDVRTSGEPVVGIEEPGIDAGDNILTFSGLACAKLRQCLAEVESVVAVLVAVRVRDNVVRIRRGDFDGRVREVDFQHVHFPGNLLELHAVIVAARGQKLLLDRAPEIVLRLDRESSAQVNGACSHAAVLACGNEREPRLAEVVRNGNAQLFSFQVNAYLDAFRSGYPYGSLLRSLAGQLICKLQALHSVRHFNLAFHRRTFVINCK